MGNIRDTADAVYLDGPGTRPAQPDKHQIRALFGTVEDAIDEVSGQVEGAASGLVQTASWAALSAIAGDRLAQPGRVSGPDGGTHADPVAGGTVPNEGEYSWSTSPAGWLRVGDLLVTKVAPLAANFVDALGFIGMRLSTDGTLLSKQPARSYELLDTRTADEAVAVSDPLGFKIFSLTSEKLSAPGLSQSDDTEFNDGFDASPLIGGSLVAFDGAETHLYARNILPQRSDLSRVRAVLWSDSATDGTRAAYSRQGDDELVVDLQKCGATVVFQTRADEVDPDTRYQASLNVVTPPVSPGTGNALTALIIGDSVSNRQIGARAAAIAAAKGYTLAFTGTINGAGINQIASDATGPLGEAREGWQIGDFTYAVTDRVLVITPGNEASYLAGDKASKFEQNPFLRAAIGSDSPDVVRNGYVFDFDFYLNRFSLPAPDLVFIELGTNDIRDLNSSEVGDAITDGLTIMCGQIKAARPGTKIILWFPPVSRSIDRDTVWTEYVTVLARIIKFARETADNDLQLVPVWAMASQEAGFPLDPGSTSDIGIQSAPLSDPIHPSPFNQAIIAEILAAAAAAVAQGSL